jgi:hypothetical protein
MAERRVMGAPAVEVGGLPSYSTKVTMSTLSGIAISAA